MDFIRFINSRDIREYLYSIDYQLSLEQKLFVVDKCYRIPLSEKLLAFEEILKEKDENILIRSSCLYNKDTKDYERVSLHEMTRSLIRHYDFLQNKLLSDEPLSYYKLSILESDRDYYISAGKFPDFKHVFDYCREQYIECPDYDYLKAFAIKKQYFDGTSDHHGNIQNKTIIANYNATGELLNIDGDFTCGDWNTFLTTDDLLIYLPMPFEKGDIAINSEDRLLKFSSSSFINSYDPKTPYVLSGTFIPDEKLSKGYDSSDINTYCYYLDKYRDCLLTSEVNEHLYDIEYYRKPVTGKFKLLKVISSILKKQKTFDVESLAFAASFYKEQASFHELKEHLSIFNREHLFFFNDEDSDCNADASEFPLFLRNSVKIWLDDERDAPSDYIHCHSVNETIKKIQECEKNAVFIEELNLDHDLGEYANDGGDAIKLLDFLVQRETFYKVKLHTANPVGRANMQRVIDRYWIKI